jgi:hypothetical protein
VLGLITLNSEFVFTFRLRIKGERKLAAVLN